MLLQGYFRRAEVECATYNFADAYKSYNDALTYKADDTTLVSLLEKVQKQHMKDAKGMFSTFLYVFLINKLFFAADEQIPWLGAGIGIILGAVIVIADFLFTKNPTVSVMAFRFYQQCLNSGNQNFIF